MPQVGGWLAGCWPAGWLAGPAGRPGVVAACCSGWLLQAVLPLEAHPAALPHPALTHPPPAVDEPVPRLPGVVLTRPGPLAAFTTKLREALKEAGAALEAAGGHPPPLSQLLGCLALLQ
jgi:hypothetical protein